MKPAALRRWLDLLLAVRFKESVLLQLDKSGSGYGLVGYLTQLYPISVECSGATSQLN